MSETQPSIVLLGAGGHCQSCIDVIEREGRFTIAGIIDRDTSLRGKAILGYSVIGTDADLPDVRRTHAHALITVGQIRSTAARVALYDRLKGLGFTLPCIVAPTACVSRHAQLGEDTIVMHHVAVNAGAHVGVNCILNTKALIEHNACVGDHSHVSTAAVVNGSARIGRRTFIGSNATVVHGVDLPDDSFVRPGLLVRSGEDGQRTQDA